jgi:hypothetical protein
MDMTTAVARNVARRYQAAVVIRDVPEPATEIIFSDGGIVTTADLRRLLEPHFGPLAKVQLQPSRAPATVTWSGIDQRGAIVSGRVVLHARLYEHRIEVWADLLVDNNGSLLRLATVEPRKLLESRLKQIGELGRRLIQQVRCQPQRPAHAIVGDLVALVDIAEEE